MWFLKSRLLHKTGILILAVIIVVLSTSIADQKFHFLTKLSSLPGQVAGVILVPDSNKFVEGIGGVNIAGALTSAPYQNVDGDVAISGNVAIAGNVTIPAQGKIYTVGGPNNDWWIGTDADYNTIVRGYKFGSRAFQVQDHSGNVGFTALYGGSVGIGTAAPVGLLDIRSNNPQVNIGGNQGTNIRVNSATGSIYFPTTSAGTWGSIIENYVGAFSDTTSLLFSTSYGGAATEKMRITGSGNVGIGITNPGAKLQVLRGSAQRVFDVNADYGTGVTGNYIASTVDARYGTSSTGNLTAFRVDATQSGSGASYAGLFMGGNVGIGTASPLGALDVNGTPGASSWTYLGGNLNGTTNPNASRANGLMIGWNSSGYAGETQILYGTNGGTTPRLDFGRWSGTVKTIDMTLKDGNVGIGTNDPQVTLDVVNAGTDYAITGRSSSPGGSGVKGSGSSSGLWGYSLNGTGVYGTGGSYDFYATGAGTDYGTGSSIRWKRDLRPIDNALNKVLSLRGLYYTWDESHGGQHGMGMIAEEVGKYVPEIVGWDPDAPGYATGMDYGHLTPVLVEAIKEQQKEIDSLKQEIEQLKAK